ncbi:hypothetical protein KSK37_13015 [Kaistella sp. DKR-2]|uniref:hypothetical protein n=1 Tax=Kaistella soli TaxID=2849654 RepID=UPI001C26DD20|nr:hypothetical protein [Kaistella soli]MBU8884010.1 hypothetical protein [Kaistella soli]
MFGEMNEADHEKLYYESDGRMFKKERFIRHIPRYTYVSGRFTGKFYSDLQKTPDERSEYYHFKIYEAEVEISHKSRIQEKIAEEEDAIKVAAHQMPEKVYFFETVEGRKQYYDLKFENPLFHNFGFVSKLQQNEGDEAFGTIEADFYGYLTDFTEEKRYRKRYRKINLIECLDCIKTGIKTGNTETKTGAYREEYFCKGNKKTYWGDWMDKEIQKGPGGTIVISDPPRPFYERFSPCFRNLILSLLVTIISGLIGFTPLFVIGLIWLFYVVYTCFFHWLRYFTYFFAFLFLIGLVYSIANTNWHNKAVAYVPHPVQKIVEKPQLIKVITLIKNGKVNDIQIQRQLKWSGYNGEAYSGTFSLMKSDLDASRNLKNSLNANIGYNNIIYNISAFDSDKLGGLYSMFDKIRSDRNLNNKQFAEMIVSFVQYIPYHAIVEGSCNPNEYTDRSIRNLLKENAGRCLPNQKFGITTPLEFLSNSQGDCDSRTVLLYTVFKHYRYNVAVLSSEVYRHSILGISLPYNGLTYESGDGKYTLWETTDRGFKPGILPPEVMNLNYWDISLK